VSHPDWFAALTVGLLFGIASMLVRLGESIDRAVRLLESLVAQQVETNSSLRSIAHDSDVIRERMPPS
jgi:hypothetical protein